MLQEYLDLDFLVNAHTEDVYFNEINTIPGSFSFYLWEKSGLSFKALIEELIAIALEKHQSKNGRIRSYDTNLLGEKAATGIKGLKDEMSSPDLSIGIIANPKKYEVKAVFETALSWAETKK